MDHIPLSFEECQKVFLKQKQKDSELQNHRQKYEVSILYNPENPEEFLVQHHFIAHFLGALRKWDFCLSPSGSPPFYCIYSYSMQSEGFYLMMTCEETYEL
mgnify:CR=1 FL=1